MGGQDWNLVPRRPVAGEGLEAKARSPGLPPGSPVDPGLKPSRNLQRVVVEFGEKSQLYCCLHPTLLS